MRSLSTLPNELLARIISLIDDRASLSNVRLVNHQFDDIAAPELFSTATLYVQWATHDEDDEELSPPGPVGYSAQSFINIVKHERLKSFVKDVVVFYCDTHCDHSQERADNEQDGWWPDPVMDEQWHKAIETIPELPNLSGFSLCFDRHAGDREDYNPILFASFDRTEALMNALNMLDGRISELSIRHYDGGQVDPSDEEIWSKTLENLKSLRISVSQEEPKMQHDVIYSHGEIHEFWEGFPEIFLKPCQDNLQCLVLYSDLPVGWCPKMDLRDVHFPNLRSLTLGHFIFFAEWQFDFITSHHATLKELYLDCCSILYQTGLRKGQKVDEEGFPAHVFGDGSSYGKGCVFRDYDLRWSDVFTLFANKFEHLRQFKFGISDEWRFDATSQYASTGDVYEAHPIMPWKSEHKIRNEISSERYLHFNGFEQRYRSEWDHEEFTERNHYVPELVDKIKASSPPDCMEEDVGALTKLLQKLGLGTNVQTSCTRKQLRKRFHTFDHRTRDWEYDSDDSVLEPEDEHVRS